MFADVDYGMHNATPGQGGNGGAGGPGRPGQRLVDAAATPSERTYATFTHLSLLAVHVLVPVIPALVMWLIRRHESPFLDDHGKEAVNFQISLLIYSVVGGLLVPFCFIGVPVLIATYVLGIAGMIMAALAANRGEYFRYPATIRLVV